MVWECMAANRTGSLVFIEDVTVEIRSKMNSQVYKAILTIHTLPIAEEMLRWGFTVQMDNEP